MPIETISHYRILDKLGEGGMGIVYKAEDLKLGRIVALKFPPPALLTSEIERSRFVQEARTSAALHHPNIATIFEIDERDGTPFLALEYIQGQTLAERILAGPVDADEAIRYTEQLCEGLREAHDLGVIHRDIKSSNLMITPSGQVKILDFGLARLRGASPVTRTGTTLGTLEYMSPEQLQGSSVDHRTDLWAVGVVLYEMLEGTRPFAAEFEAAVAYKILNEDPRPLVTARDDSRMQLAPIILRLLAKKAEERYPSAEDVLSDLRAIKAGGSVPGPRQPRHRVSRKKALLSLGGVALGAVAVVATIRLISGVTPIGPDGQSLAVLPFQNFGDDKQDEYFSDGMTDELINTLVKIDGLRVPSRSSVFAFKGKHEDIRRISEQLNVATVLEGSVRRAGDRVRVSARLINASDGFTLWADTYEREMKDIFAIQDDITRRIAEMLKVAFQERAGTLARHPTRDLEAYNLYLRGMYHINRRSAGDIRAGLGFFQQAIDRDSLFAQAYAGISEGYVLLAAQAALSPSEAYPRALRAALEAVRLDQRSAEAHTCFAHIAFHMADLTTARREFRLALDLEPRFAPAHHFATELFLSTDQLDSARAAIRRSLDLGPLDLAANAMLSSVLLQERRFDEAIRQLHQTLDLDSNYFLAHLALGSAYAARGDVERAAREYTIGARLTGGNRGWGALGLLYAKTGRTGDARAILDTMTRRSATLYTSPWEIARIWAALRDRENSLSWLERALDDDPWSADKVKDSPEFTILAGDPRFDRLISRAIHTASLSTASLPH